MITHKNAIAMLSGLVYLVEKVRYITAKHCNYINPLTVKFPKKMLAFFTVNLVFWLP